MAKRVVSYVEVHGREGKEIPLINKVSMKLLSKRINRMDIFNIRIAFRLIIIYFK